MRQMRLSLSDLERLTFQWETWAASATTAARKVVRMRLHLLFLLVRYGGLRLREVLDMDAKKAVDTVNCMVHVGGQYPRDIQLPICCMKHVRRILSLPEAESMGPEFLRFDQGFVRRKCYEVAAPLGLDSALVGPRALRYARGLEMLETHIPFNLVQAFLGQQQPSQIAAFLEFAGGEAGRILRSKASDPSVPEDGVNTFVGIVTDVREGQRTVSVEVTTFSDIRLRALCPYESFTRTELRHGQVVTAVADGERILLSPSQPFCSEGNAMRGTLLSLHRDRAETFAAVSLPDGTRIRSVHDTEMLDRLDLREQQKIWVLIPSRGIRLYTD